MRTICLIAAAGLALAGCSSVAKNNVLSGTLTGGGVSITAAPTPGLQAGYMQSKFTSHPVMDGKGAPFVYKVQCGVESNLSVYDIHNGNASASAATNSGPASSIAVNQATITGDAARLAALGGGQAPSPAAINALNDCSRSIPTTAGGAVAQAVPAQ